MLTVIEDAGPRLGEVAMLLAAFAALLLAVKDFVLKLRSTHPHRRFPSEATSAKSLPPP
jgi:hypothetical protein